MLKLSFSSLLAHLNRPLPLFCPEMAIIAPSPSGLGPHAAIRPCTSYVIYRDGLEIATVPAGTLSFTNTNRMPGWPCSYRYGRDRIFLARRREFIVLPNLTGFASNILFGVAVSRARPCRPILSQAGLLCRIDVGVVVGRHDASLSL